MKRVTFSALTSGFAADPVSGGDQLRKPGNKPRVARAGTGTFFPESNVKSSKTFFAANSGLFVRIAIRNHVQES
jgi:hypothetical protein